MKTRHRRKPERARTELLAAATTLFANLGFDRTSLAAVGDRAGVSRGLPAYFFRNKKNLYHAVIERATELMRKAVLSAVHAQSDQATIDEVLTSIVSTYIEALNANPEAVRLLQWESLNPVHTRQDAPNALFEQAVGLVEKALKRSGNTGVDARLLLLSIVGMCFFPFANGGGFKRRPGSLVAYKKHILDMVLTGTRGAK